MRLSAIRSLLAGLLLLLFTTPVWAANAFVQSAQTTTGNVALGTVAVAFVSNVTAGNLIAVGITWYNDPITLSSVTDTLGNTYTVVQTVNIALAQRYATAYAKNILGGANTVTATFSLATAIFRGIIVHEVSGADTTAPLDKNAGQVQTAPGTGANAVTSGAVVSTTDGQYLFGFTAEGAGVSTTITQGTGYTLRQRTQSSTTTEEQASEDQIQATAASIAATFTIGTDTEMGTLILTFKAAGAAAATPQRTLIGVGQ